ncbi:hypothetical protein L484_003033 [Morus notabilis]|uniref:Uncharacterized protein n=1 Tax=Morus notabilis TaxID=981085 RepID=W9R326_9ROSA|nr:hypothetical protein L484_003033 [Morus notabilis]
MAYLAALGRPRPSSLDTRTLVIPNSKRADGNHSIVHTKSQGKASPQRQVIA